MVSEKNQAVISRAADSVDQLADEKFEFLLSNVQRIWPLTDEDEVKTTIEWLAQELEIDPLELTKAVAWVVAIARHVSEGGSEDELAEIEAIKNSPRLELRVRAAFKAAKEDEPRFERVSAKIAAAQGVLPSFEELIGTVELRGVLAKGGDLDQISSLAPYIALEPVASILLRLDAGFPSAIAFQISRNDLAKMMESLAKVENRMAELERLAGVGE